jgi:hypothetical protein
MQYVNILTSKFYATHSLLYVPSLNEWLAFTCQQINATFGSQHERHRSQVPRVRAAVYSSRTYPLHMRCNTS